jgi:hypothetical protein
MNFDLSVCHEGTFAILVFVRPRKDRALNFVARSDLIVLNRNRFKKRLPEFRGNLKAGCSVGDFDASEGGDLNPSPSTSGLFGHAVRNR